MIECGIFYDSLRTGLCPFIELSLDNNILTLQCLMILWMLFLDLIEDKKVSLLSQLMDCTSFVMGLLILLLLINVFCKGNKVVLIELAYSKVSFYFK